MDNKAFANEDIMRGRSDDDRNDSSPNSRTSEKSPRTSESGTRVEEWTRHQKDLESGECTKVDPKVNPMDAETILEELGRCGVYQLLVYFLVSLVCMRGVWHLFGPIFFGIVPSHHCTVTTNATLNDSLPLETMDGVTTWARCSMYMSDGIHGNQTEYCQNGWTYSEENYEATIATEWDLVCDNSYMVDLSSSIFMSGMMVGSLFLSPLADKFGRKKVLLAALWLQGIVGVAAAFSNSFVLFTVLRFILGALNQTIGLVAYVMVPEAFPSSSRTIPYIAIYLFWALGIMSLALLGYLIRNWRYLQLVISLPSFLTVIYYWILPESIPWLMAKQRYKEVEKIIRKAARLNGKVLPTELYNMLATIAASKLLTEQNMTPKHVHVTHGSNENVEKFNPDNDRTSKYGHSTSNGDENDKSVESFKIDTGTTNNPHNGGVTLLNVTAMDDTGMLNSPSALTEVDRDQPKSNGDGSKMAAMTLTNQAPVSYSVIDLFRTPRMRLYSLVMFYLWLVNSLGYFGLSFVIPTLHGDPFLNIFLSGAVEIPAYLICMLTVESLGRRRPLCVFMLVCGVASTVAIFIPETTDSGADLSWLKTTLAMISKFGITGSYATVYLFCCEIFPTVVRNLGLGLAAFFETVGAVAAPFIASSVKTLPLLPPTLFAVLTAVGGVLCLLLPETHRKALPETIEEIEHWTRQSGMKAKRETNTSQDEHKSDLL